MDDVASKQCKPVEATDPLKFKSTQDLLSGLS